MYVPALSKVPLFLFPGTVTLGSNNHSGLETAIESKICTFYFLLSNIAKMSKSRYQDNLIQFFLNLGPQADCNFLEVSARWAREVRPTFTFCRNMQPQWSYIIILNKFTIVYLFKNLLKHIYINLSTTKIFKSD